MCKYILILIYGLCHISGCIDVWDTFSVWLVYVLGPVWSMLSIACVEVRGQRSGVGYPFTIEDPGLSLG